MLSWLIYRVFDARIVLKDSIFVNPGSFGIKKPPQPRRRDGYGAFLVLTS
jgi:hypothetical protein